MSAADHGLIKRPASESADGSAQRTTESSADRAEYECCHCDILTLFGKPPRAGRRPWERPFYHHDTVKSGMRVNKPFAPERDHQVSLATADLRQKHIAGTVWRKAGMHPACSKDRVGARGRTCTHRIFGR